MGALFMIGLGTVELLIALACVLNWSRFQAGVLHWLQESPEAKKGRFAWDQSNAKLAAYALLAFLMIQGAFVIAVGVAGRPN